MASRARHIQALVRGGTKAWKWQPAAAAVTSQAVRTVTSLNSSVPPAEMSNQTKKLSTQVQQKQEVTCPDVKEIVQNDGRKWLEITFKDGNRAQFPYVYLRDNCQCSTCFHPTSRARLFLMQNLDLNIKPKSAKVTGDGDVHMVWPDGHESHFTSTWLNEHAFTREKREKHSRIFQIERKLWGVEEIYKNLPVCDYEEVMNNDKALFEFLVNFRSYGLGLLKNMKGRGGMLQFCNRIAFERVTHYGEMFQVKTKIDPSNLTYTGASLGLHTDLTYYDYQPGIQFLHCLQQAEGIGGDNGFVDAFNVGYHIKEHRPDLYQILCSLPVDSWDTGSDFRDFYKVFRVPIIRLDQNNKIWQIRYNNQVRDSFMDMDVNMVGPMYEALKEFDNYCYHPELTIKYKLQSGEMIMFDNWRVLHSRYGYNTDTPTQRELEGGFMDWDEVHSTIRMLREKLSLPME